MGISFLLDRADFGDSFCFKNQKHPSLPRCKTDLSARRTAESPAEVHNLNLEECLWRSYAVLYLKRQFRIVFLR